MREDAEDAVASRPGRGEAGRRPAHPVLSADRRARIVAAVRCAVATDPVLAPDAGNVPEWVENLLAAVESDAVGGDVDERGVDTDGRASALAEIPTGVIDHVRRCLLADWADQPGVDAAGPLGVLTGLESLRQRSLVSDGASPTGMEFVAGVAHDLRSPLTSILFLAETLQSEVSGEVNPLQRRQLGIIYSAALGLVSVASDIIELARGSSALTEREPQTFSITEIMRSVHDMVRPLAEEKGLSVHLFPPENDLRTGHPLALSRVLLNLTTNGLKFTDEGFVEIAVREMSPSRLEFAVRDTGKGYEADAIDHLYQPFRRSADGKKYGFSGSGLGLTISRRLVTAMGSELRAESRPTWGTRFWFNLDLPIAPTEREP